MIRPTATVYKVNGEVQGETAMPYVFQAPIRSDIVHYVYHQMRKNSRQAYGVLCDLSPHGRVAGMQHSAHSWGTGRAVSRIPRVSGSGSSRTGQGAFGRMFAPTKTWRKWHRRTNVNQRRFAAVSAIAGSAVVPLVQARGHKISGVQEIPIVVSDTFQGVQKTREALETLRRLGLGGDLVRAKSKKKRAGQGTRRNRRFIRRKGPLVVYAEDNGITKAVRNLPGVDYLNVDRLNLLNLAPGGVVGRVIVWTESAFKKLDSIYGTLNKNSSAKNGYRPPRGVMTVTDVSRIINSEEVQSKLRPVKKLGQSVRRAHGRMNIRDTFSARRRKFLSE